MAYSASTLDHYERPRNVGSFGDNEAGVGSALVSAPAGGDVLRLQIRVDARTGVLEEARFKTHGCVAAFAASSLRTEWIRGKTLEQAASLKSSQIVQALALPPEKIYCAMLAEDAIKAAVEDYLGKHSRQPS